jgi:hypothetical protein
LPSADNRKGFEIILNPNGFKKHSALDLPTVTQEEWDQYLRSLKDAHARKRRLIEILDGLEGRPIVKKGR